MTRFDDIMIMLSMLSITMAWISLIFVKLACGLITSPILFNQLRNDLNIMFVNCKQQKENF